MRGVRHCPTVHVITSGRTHQGRAPGEVSRSRFAIRKQGARRTSVTTPQSPFKVRAFARAAWRARLRRPHGAGSCSRLDEEWAAELKMPARDVDDIHKEDAFGAVWGIIEDRSLLFVRQLLRADRDCRRQIAHRASLNSLPSGRADSGARQHVQPKFGIPIHALSTTQVDPICSMKQAAASSPLGG